MIEISRVEYKVCKRCGRPLKSIECKERGYGRVCWEKHKKSKRVKKLFAI